jgi:hypothetical protein
MRRIVALVTVMVVVSMSVVLGGSALLGVGRAADKGVVVVQVGGGVWADASLQAYVGPFEVPPPGRHYAMAGVCPKVSLCSTERFALGHGRGMRDPDINVAVPTAPAGIQQAKVGGGRQGEGCTGWGSAAGGR